MNIPIPCMCACGCTLMCRLYDTLCEACKLGRHAPKKEEAKSDGPQN